MSEIMVRLNRRRVCFMTYNKSTVEYGVCFMIHSKSLVVYRPLDAVSSFSASVRRWNHNCRPLD